MSEERPKGFLSRVFGPVEDDDHTSVYRERTNREVESGGSRVQEADDVAIEETGRSFTVERAAEIIKHLPPEVPRSSAVRIVRQTLVAAGIDMDDLTRSTTNREGKLNEEIDQREGRIEELRQKTDETVRDLERRIREAREDRDTGVAAEERRIATAEDGLEDVERVRDFFDLPGDDGQGNAPGASEEHRGPLADDDSGDEVSDDTMIIGRPDSGDYNDETRIISRPGSTDSGGSQDDWNTRSDRNS